MLPVGFKKWSCRPVEFKGQGPQTGGGSKGRGIYRSLGEVHVEIPLLLKWLKCK